MLDHNAKDVPFTIGINQYSDLSESDFQQKFGSGLKLPARKKKIRLGYKVPMNDRGEDIVDSEPLDDDDARAFKVPVGSLPDYLNWFDKGYITRPYD